jgi:putative acyl-CoA dehydrogenase
VHRRQRRDGELHLPRLYRESPINPIWEGSGNVQCLDVLRAMRQEPEVVRAFFAELARRAAAARCSTATWRRCRPNLPTCRSSSTARATSSTAWRWRMQAALLVQHAPAFGADAFCASRLACTGHHQYGALPRGVDCTAIIERATPRA